MDERELEKEFIKDGPHVLAKIEEMAEKESNKLLIYYGEEDRPLTYSAINRMANQFGRNLSSMGVGKGDRISLFLKNPLTTALAMFGIWKVGAIFSPINFNYKGRLLSYQIKDTAPKLLVTEQSMVSFVNDVAANLPDLDVILYQPGRDDHDYSREAAAIKPDRKFRLVSFDELLSGDDSNLNVVIEYYDTANIIYTSGTTGPAKGVVQSHRWISQYTFSGRKLLHPDDVIYNDLPLYHVGGAFSNLARGAWTGCAVALWDKFSPKDFWRRIHKCGASRTTLLDVMIPWLMSAPETPQDRVNPLKFAHMQPLPQYHHKVAKRFGIDLVSGGYGQTEAGGGFLGLIDELEEGEGTPPELYKGYSREEVKEIARKWGYPVVSGKDELKKGFMGKSVTIEPAVLNEKDEKLGPGQYGQLAFRSKVPYSMLNEYFNKPEASVEIFKNQWFHTGDAVYKDENEIYYFVDRMGGFIRTRGENISSYQIEDFINSHPQVSVSAAFPIPAAEGDEDDIVVYLVLKPGENLEEETLRTWIKGEMPKFMWPKHIRFIDDLPKTPTNKIEKYRLKEMILEERKRKKN
jgi:crotonobetaine/carnitine-CoA ligase